MYILKIDNDNSSFGFIEREKEVLNSNEYRISDQEYFNFFRMQEEGKQFRLKSNIDFERAEKIEDFIEEFIPNNERPLSPSEILEKENLKLKLAMAEIIEEGLV